MSPYPNILLIGGNARHSGKTSLACSVISKFAPFATIIGLKVTRIKAGEEQFHGTHEENLDSGWSIIEETNFEGEKDTSRMLAAGAAKVYYIRVMDHQVSEAVTAFLSSLSGNEFIVCESRSLRNYITPGIFVLMIRETEGSKDISSLEGLADMVCRDGSNSNAIERITENIEAKNGRWEFTG